MATKSPNLKPKRCEMYLAPHHLYYILSALPIYFSQHLRNTDTPVFPLIIFYNRNECPPHRKRGCVIGVYKLFFTGFPLYFCSKSACLIFPHQGQPSGFRGRCPVPASMSLCLFAVYRGHPYLRYIPPLLGMVN